MPKIYTVYSSDFAPSELKTKHPQAAQYAGGNLTLFVESLEQATGQPAPEIVRIATMDITNAQLDAMIDQLMTETPTGREIQLSKAQGRYLYETRFKVEQSPLQ